MVDQITYYMVKKLKHVEKHLIFHLELFQQVQFINCYIYMICRLQKPSKGLQGLFVEILLHKSGGSALAVFQEISH